MHGGPETEHMSQPRTPFLHDLVTTFAAPTQVLSDRSGQIGAHGMAVGAQGVLHADVRVLSAIEVTVDGAAGEHIATRALPVGSDGSAGVRFSHLLRHVAPDLTESPDPQVRLDRERRVRPGQVAETLIIGSLLPEPVTVRVEVTLAYDLAPIAVIRVGDTAPALEFPLPTNGAWVWGSDEVTVRLTAPGADIGRSPTDADLRLTWSLTLPARGTAQATWSIDIVDQDGVVVPAANAPLDPVELAGRLTGPAPDHRLRPWLEQSLADLNSLRMATRAAPDDPFFAAGSPWYLTLFGRDSLWTARLLLPLDPGYAMSTLRTLAGLAGDRVDGATAQQPGKIPHELRRAGFALGGMELPPLYYGTIDATLLWICVLHDAWRAGAPEAEVRALLPALDGALRWMTDYGDADGDGFLEYVDASGRGWPTRAGRTRRTRSGSATEGWRRPGRALRGAGVRVRGGGQWGRAAGRVRPAGRGRVSELGRRADDQVPRAVLVRFRGRPLPGAGSGRAQGAGRCADQQHRAPARHRSARSGRGAGGRPAPGRSGARLRLGPAHHVLGRGGVRAAELPLRFGLAARHGDRHPRPAPGGAGRVRGRADRGPAAGRGRLRVPAARTVVGEGARCPIRVLPAAGLVGAAAW